MGSGGALTSHHRSSAPGRVFCQMGAQRIIQIPGVTVCSQCTLMIRDEAY